MHQLNQEMVCLYITNEEGKEILYIYEDIFTGGSRSRLDLFESEKAARLWLKEEKELFTQANQRGNLAQYNKLSPGKILLTQLWELVDKDETIDSITVVDEDCVRRLYFRDNFHYCKSTFPKGIRPILPKEPLHMVVRNRDKTEKLTIMKESYFVTFPEIAMPLFSVGVASWAEQQVAYYPDQNYYIEETTLLDVYHRNRLTASRTNFFLFTREASPHYLLRSKDLKKIVDGSREYQ